MELRDINIEEWRDSYEVSSEGILYSKAHTSKYGRKWERVERAPFIADKGIPYYRVQLSRAGKKRTYMVHYLVAITFPDVCGEWFEGAQVDHINGNPQDNRAENLRFVTRTENMNNPITKQRISNALKGRVFSDEWRAKISEGAKRRWIKC